MSADVRLNWIDRVVAAVDPVAGLRRLGARRVLSHFGQYESGGQANRTTTTKRSNVSGDSLLDIAGPTIRERARWLDENHDLAIGILDTLVDHVIGEGISVEPQVRDASGKLHEPINKRLRELHEDWAKKPEVTWSYDLAGAERMAALHWLRDGEVLGQHVAGGAKNVAHGTLVPYSLELIEADYLPLDYNDLSKNIRQGVQCNAWNRPTAFWLYKQHPADRTSGLLMADVNSLKQVNAENILFLRFSRRLSQRRGVSIFNSIIARLGDLKQYEDFERVAAQVAAALTVFIARTEETECPAFLDSQGSSPPLRQMGAGMVLEGAPGEEPKILQSNRPNNLIVEYRRGQLQAISAGSGAGYSSISKDYDGSYSSQRQELVESHQHYRPLRRYFINRWSRPVYERFVAVAMVAGLIDARELAGADMTTLLNAQFSGQPMPWVDPLKEVQATEKEMRLRIKSRSQVIRERGGNPREVIDQCKQDDLEMPLPATDEGEAIPPEPAEPLPPPDDEQRKSNARLNGTH